MKVQTVTLTVDLEDVTHEELRKAIQRFQEKQGDLEIYFSGTLGDMVLNDYVRIGEVGHNFIVFRPDVVTTAKYGGYSYEKIRLKKVVKKG